VGAIITRGSRILLARRAAAPYAGTWDVAGGFLEAGETPEQALRRELNEELGVEPRTARLVGFVTERYGRGGFPVLAILYAVQLAGIPRPGSDVSEVRWFPRERVPFSAIGFPAVRRALRDYLRGARGHRR
jgi:ADP-ribose pyrophosphatase YjhB (NUDIX family)